MPHADDPEKRIREGFKFLRRTGRAAIRAAAIIQKVQGVTNPVTAAKLLKRYSFKVDGGVYKGWLTKQQKAYLAGQTGSLLKFANAVGKLVARLDVATCNVLKDVSAGLSASGKYDGVIPVSPVGCCTYDATCDNTTQATCYGPLQGTNWSQNPCRKKGADKKGADAVRHGSK